ncbi:MAG: RNA polymerase-binding protein DksA, partial [Methylococcales bacterium]
MTGNKKSEGALFNFEPYEVTEGEEYMNEAQIEHFRSILENWKSALMKEVDRTVHHMQDDAANFPDPND